MDSPPKCIGLADQDGQVRCSHRNLLGVYERRQAIDETNQFDVVGKHGHGFLVERQVEAQLHQLGRMIVLAMGAHEEAHAGRGIQPVGGEADHTCCTLGEVRGGAAGKGGRS
jgi:hypothetical protein